MKKELHTLIHNRFDFEVADAVTGEIRQRATSYNIILDHYMTSLVDRSNRKMTYIQIGTGTGTLSASRTSLFSYLGGKATMLVETVKQYPTSYTRRKIVLLPGDYVGETITEVGFAGYNNASGSLNTHSLLKDSEGNPIAILKTDTDVVTIYATFYVTIGQPADDTYVLATPESSFILSTIFDESTNALTVTAGVHNGLATANDLMHAALLSTAAFWPESDHETNSWLIPTQRFDYNSAANGHYISSIGIANIAAWNLPNSVTFPNVLLEGMAVGSGDGTTTAYNCPVPSIVPGSEKMRKNGVLLVNGTDYTIDYENNHLECPELFISSDARNCDVSGGLMSSYSNGKPFCIWDNVATNPCQALGENAPLIFDFRTPIRVNRLILPAECLSANGWSTGTININIGLDYSNDGITWTNFYTTDTAVYREVTADVRLAEPVTARYWRLTTSGSSLSFGTYDCPNICFGYVTPGITFLTAPAEGDILTMDCQVNRPFKNENWVLDFGFTVTFERS